MRSVVPVLLAGSAVVVTALGCASSPTTVGGLSTDSTSTPIAAQILAQAQNHAVVDAVTGQDVVLRAGMIGPGGFDSLASVSAFAVRFAGSSYAPLQNPGGPTVDFRFRAEEPGISTVKISATSGLTIVETIIVR